MIRTYKSFQPDELIADDRFFHAARSRSRGDVTAWHELAALYPGHEEALEEAYVIVCSLKIDHEVVPQREIESRLFALKVAIRRKQSLRRMRRWSFSAAATVLVAAAVMFAVVQGDRTRSGQILASLRTAQSYSDSVEIIAGSGNRMLLGGDATIRQNHDGTLTIISSDNVTRKAVESEYIHLSVPYGKRSFVEFSDGTRAMLNSGSHLVYPASFGQGKREIYLAGEIYLDVAKDASWPFHVRTDKLDVRVLGTSFNITAYNDDGYADVVLVEGSVEVTTVSKQKAVISPGNCLHYDGNRMSVRNVDVAYYTGWKDGYIKLNGDPLSEVFKRLSRYYNVNICCDNALGDVRYRGKLDLGESIEKALGNISLTEPLVFTRNGREVRVGSKSSL